MNENHPSVGLIDKSPPAEQAVSRDSVTSRKAGRFYQPGLDVLRSLAFFLVLTQHALPKVHNGALGLWDAIEEFGDAGVCLFFTLSAFLITSLLLREAEETGTIHMRAFYVRRILRIWPLYLTMIVLGVAFPHFYHHFPRGEPFVIPYLAMFGNWEFVWHGATRNTIFAPLWSISVEEQFYVIWPALFLFFRRRGILAAAVILLPLAWVTDYTFPSLHNPNRLALWCNSFSQFQFFALGGLLALIMHKRTLRIATHFRLLAIAAAFGFFLLAAYFLIQTEYPATRPGLVLAGYLSIDIGCLVFLCAFLDVRLPAFCKPLVYLGKISYGLYVFHMVILGAIVHFLETTLHVSLPVKTFLTYTLTTMTVIPLAALSYEYFEKPFLRFKDRFTFVPSRSA